MALDGGFRTEDGAPTPGGSPRRSFTPGSGTGCSTPQGGTAPEPDRPSAGHPGNLVADFAGDLQRFQLPAHLSRPARSVDLAVRSLLDLHHHLPAAASTQPLDLRPSDSHPLFEPGFRRWRNRRTGEQEGRRGQRRCGSGGGGFPADHGRDSRCGTGPVRNHGAGGSVPALPGRGPPLCLRSRPSPGGGGHRRAVARAAAGGLGRGAGDRQRLSGRSRRHLGPLRSGRRRCGRLEAFLPAAGHQLPGLAEGQRVLVPQAGDRVHGELGRATTPFFTGWPSLPASTPWAPYGPLTPLSGR